MVDLDNMSKANYNPNASTLQSQFNYYVESDQNRWLIRGRNLSGKVFFRHLCWDCFFKHLPEIENISKRALKSTWYRDIKNGIMRPPVTCTSPSKYFKLLFDITDEELAAEHSKFDTASLESFIRRHGPINGPIEYEKYKKRQAYTCSKEYMMNERGMTEDQWNEYNASRAVTKENLILKHGEDIGLKMWKEYCDRQAYAGCKLEYFIEKYGDDVGRKEYERVNKMKVISHDNFIRKYGKEEGEKRWKHWSENALRMYSEISCKLFSEIDRKDQFSKKNSRYGTKPGGEASVEVEVNGKRKVYHPDYILGNKIIEFYGDYFHANPMKYDDNFVILDRTAKEIREHNHKRVAALETAGYKVKIVWEHEYRHNVKSVVNECLEFLHQ